MLRKPFSFGPLQPAGAKGKQQNPQPETMLHQSLHETLVTFSRTRVNPGQTLRIHPITFSCPIQPVFQKPYSKTLNSKPYRTLTEPPNRIRPS